MAFKVTCWVSRNTKRNGSSGYVSIWDKKPIFQKEVGVFCGRIKIKGEKKPAVKSIGNIDIDGQKLVGYGQTKKVKITIEGIATESTEDTEK